MAHGDRESVDRQTVNRQAVNRQAVNWEAWTERQIREATDRGEFDGLPGTGQPIPDIDRPHDELWWVRQKLRRENVSYLPPALAIRKEAEDALAAATEATSEAEARRIVAAVNERIRALLRNPPVSGPPMNLMPLDLDRVTDDWRARHPAPPEPVDRAIPHPVAGATRRSRWRRRRGRGRR